MDDDFPIAMHMLSLLVSLLLSMVSGNLREHVRSWGRIMCSVEEGVAGISSEDLMTLPVNKSEIEAGLWVTTAALD